MMKPYGTSLPLKYNVLLVFQKGMTIRTAAVRIRILIRTATVYLTDWELFMPYQVSNVTLTQHINNMRHTFAGNMSV